jgi:hypothetical protein
VRAQQNRHNETGGWAVSASDSGVLSNKMWEQAARTRQLRRLKACRGTTPGRGCAVGEGAALWDGGRHGAERVPSRLGHWVGTQEQGGAQLGPRRHHFRLWCATDAQNSSSKANTRAVGLQSTHVLGAAAQVCKQTKDRTEAAASADAITDSGLPRGHRTATGACHEQVQQYRTVWTTSPLSRHSGWGWSAW